jgi:hypothetical protein
VADNLRCFRLLFVDIHVLLPTGSRPTVYVVTYKKCTRSFPAGVQEFPRSNLVVQCPLCGELRRYRL